MDAGENAVCLPKLEYADDAALIDENVEQASARVTTIAKGSLEEAAMVISIRKSKAMHIHKKTRVSATTEADVASLNLLHKCSACAREFTKQSGLRTHMAWWCDGGLTQRPWRGWSWFRCELGSWDELWSIFQLIAVNVWYKRKYSDYLCRYYSTLAYYIILDYLRINTSCIVCVYVCICTYVYMYVYICIFIYVYIYIYASICGCWKKKKKIFNSFFIFIHNSN